MCDTVNVYISMCSKLLPTYIGLSGFLHLSSSSIDLLCLSSLMSPALCLQAAADAWESLERGGGSQQGGGTQHEGSSWCTGEGKYGTHTYICTIMTRHDLQYMMCVCVCFQALQQESESAQKSVRKLEAQLQESRLQHSERVHSPCWGDHIRTYNKTVTLPHENWVFKLAILSW